MICIARFNPNDSYWSVRNTDLPSGGNPEAVDIHLPTTKPVPYEALNSRVTLLPAGDGVFMFSYMQIIVEDLVENFQGVRNYLDNLLGAELMLTVLGAEEDRARCGFTAVELPIITPVVNEQFVHRPPIVVFA